ncbi:MAG: M23 family peptidase [Epsilonproteobacteria bacterium]|nr:MAG: M23 family peptidase [Campylobacterota bacterium]
MRNRRAKKGGLGIGIIIFTIVLMIGGGYIYTSEDFEREAPVIHGEKNIFWNRAEALSITLSDNAGLKSFELILSDGKNHIMVGQGNVALETKEQTLLVKYPKSKLLDIKAKKLSLKVQVKDQSKWNFFQGNVSEQIINIQIDHKRPNVNVLANSYSITQGGSALVVFQAEDENLDVLYVQAGDLKFKAQPYKKEGYYAALIAWPFDKEVFSAKIIAIDVAGNKRHTDIAFYVKNHSYRVSWIKARDKFIDGKITDLARSDPEYDNINDRFDRFRAINETMRLRNEDMIRSLGQNVSSEILESWNIQKFYPLRNGQKVASYGDKRHYYYEDKSNEISHSYHVGYDLASTKMATIKTSNAGKVVYVGENGIYGNMPMIDHGLGLYSLYGHCSQVLVSKGEEVSIGQAIAKTGVSGLALGDHLHFGLLVQGVEVRPVEWFDKEWIRKNIDNIFKDANKIIEGR